MRRIACLTIAALSFAACSNETTAPNTSDLTMDAGAFGTALTVAGGYEAEVYQTRLANGLPDSLKLTDAQQAKIKALIDAFNATTKADRETLNAILQQARDAAKGKDRSADVGKILAKGVEIRVRLAAAEAKLKADIDAELTADQRAWLAAHEPKKCKPDRFAPLSDTQKGQIKALEKAFEDNNRADLQALKAAYQSADGKSKAERETILAGVAPAIARLETARKALTAAIGAVLTPEQKASGCLPLG
ncbi:MAG: Spy/CpxP family protein refolding chaperone [Gemmatimonadales bacterium]